MLCLFEKKSPARAMYSSNTHIHTHTYVWGTTPLSIYVPLFVVFASVTKKKKNVFSFLFVFLLPSRPPCWRSCSVYGVRVISSVNRRPLHNHRRRITLKFRTHTTTQYEGGEGVLVGGNHKGQRNGRGGKDRIKTKMQDTLCQRCAKKGGKEKEKL
jgi:hypothetical protein